MSEEVMSEEGRECMCMSAMHVCMCVSECLSE